MSTFLRRYALLGVAFGCICVGSTALAGPDDFDRIVVFGDSLSDNGNLFALSTNTAPDPTLYPENRFSNGPVWAEQIFGPMNSPYQTTGVTNDVNLAIGGARADVDVGFPFGVPQQITDFQNAGGTFGDGDVVALWAGANDVLQFFGANMAPTGGQIVANSLDAANDQLGNISTLIGAGAKTVLVFNLPNIGDTPFFNGSPTTAGAGSLATSSFNDALRAGVSSLAAANPDVNFVYVDIDEAFSVIQANPGAFGLYNTTGFCRDARVGDANACDGFLFYDEVHPTVEGQAAIAAYVTELLSVEEDLTAFGALADNGLFTAVNSQSQVFDRLKSWLTGAYALQNGPYIDIFGGTADYNRDGGPDFSTDAYGVRVGLDRQIGDGLVGVSAYFINGDISGEVSTDTFTAGADIYGSVSFGQAFLNVGAGGGVTSYDDVRRTTGVPSVAAEGSTTGAHYGAAGEAGVIFSLGDIALMPAARLGYVASEIDSFTETATLLALSLDEQDASAAYWGASIRAAAALSALGDASVFVEGGYEDFLSDENDGVTGRLADNFAASQTATIDELSGRGATVKAGLSKKFEAGLSIDARYDGAFSDDVDAHGGSLRVKFEL